MRSNEHDSNSDDPDPSLPPAAAAPLAAELLVQHAADRDAAPDPEDVAETVRRMALNGLVDPDLEQ